MKFVKKLSIRIKLVFLIIMGAIAGILIGFFSLINMSQIKTIWDIYENTTYKKNIYTTDILLKVGYGGYIHTFKNYIIRNDEKPFNRCEELYNELIEDISSYEKIGFYDEQEKILLNKLKEMVDVYHIKLLEVKKLIGDGKSTKEIDEIIRIDDEPYYNSLKSLVDKLNIKTGEEKKRIENIAFRMTIILLIVIPLGIIGILISGILFSRGITNGIKDFIKKFKLGTEGDLTITMPEMANSKNEINTLAIHFNKFTNLLNTIITQVKDSIEKTKSISSNLESISEQTSASLTGMTSSTKSMKDKVLLLDNEINAVNNSIKEVKTFIAEVVKLISSQASAMSESSASIEEMSASIQNIAKVTEEKLKITNLLEDTATSGEQEMGKTMEIIKRVAESAGVIVDMMSVINNIAGQTNLLAMNASIEAAHAGESGRGFAVVADEIRKLAETTTQNSKDISSSLKKIITDIHTSEESTKKTASFFTSIVFGVKGVANSMMEMKNTTQELAIASSDMITALGKLVEMTEDVKISSEEVNTKIIKITESINTTNIISADVKNSMEEVSIGISELFANSGIVHREGSKNMESVIELETIVNKFKVNNKNENKEKMPLDIKPIEKI